MSDWLRDPESLARTFHESYERLAPSFGYETRKESAVPWADVPERNRALMIAVVQEVTGDLARVALDLADALRRVTGHEGTETVWQPGTGQSWQFWRDEKEKARAALAAFDALAPKDTAS